MRRIIINADDCGKTPAVDSAIGEAILKRKISSTTIMANMDDFDGAVRLYNEYKEIISFGWHINLTEGVPLTQSQLLLDKGFYKEADGLIQFNGETFWRQYMNKPMRSEIKKELRAQYEKLRDNGIEITHADGHHHIHTAPSMILIMPSLFKELRIKRCRHIMNYGVSSFSFWGRQIWALPFRFRGIKMPDTLTSFNTYYSNSSLRQGATVELECHPGHPKEVYKKEMELMYATDIESWNAQFITYKEL